MAWTVAGGAKAALAAWLWCLSAWHWVVVAVARRMARMGTRRGGERAAMADEKSVCGR
jgi:hypothetical protein